MHINDYDPAYEVYPLMRRVDELEEKMEKGNMKSFMFLHAEKNGALVMIAVEHITVMTDNEKFTRIYTDDGDYTDVKETFTEITKSLIGMEIN